MSPAMTVRALGRGAGVGVQKFDILWGIFWRTTDRMVRP